MHRRILTCVFVALVSTAVCAQQQQAPASDPYTGQSHPPADDVITTAPAEIPKPPAGKPLVTPPAQPVASPAPSAEPVLQKRDTAPGDAAESTDDGIVQVAPESTVNDPQLSTRTGGGDPDGDIVHPDGISPNALPPGTMIRARLLTELSTTESQRGEVFRARVASDVLQDGNVLIPAGSEIDGRVVEVSEGSAGGHGSIRLRPDYVVFADGSHFRLDAQVIGTPGSKTNVNGEGVINAGSRFKKDGLEYGGAMGAGAATGAVVGGPVGALAGTLIGAGAITVHLLVDHPQADLQPGTVLLFSLNSRLNLVAASNQAKASAE